MIDISVTDDIAACQGLRRAVFMEEQGVSEAEEFDGLDSDAIHLLATVGGVPMGTARLFVTGSVGKIGRVCVLQQARGTGLGAALMRAACDHFRVLGGVDRVVLDAQIHALGFYQQLGFVAEGDEFDDAGIPHMRMVHAL